MTTKAGLSLTKWPAFQPFTAGLHKIWHKYSKRLQTYCQRRAMGIHWLPVVEKFLQKFHRYISEIRQFTHPEISWSWPLQWNTKTTIQMIKDRERLRKDNPFALTQMKIKKQWHCVRLIKLLFSRWTSFASSWSAVWCSCLSHTFPCILIWWISRMVCGCMMRTRIRQTMCFSHSLLNLCFHFTPYFAKSFRVLKTIVNCDSKIAASHKSIQRWWKILLTRTFWQLV